MPETKRDSAGFRLRGLETTRIETFTDAAFAFALTLLVVSLDPPTSFEDLRAALREVPAFLLSATMLMMFWYAHHEWSRRYGLDDLVAVLLSCMLVFTVLVYVYPLRFVFSLMMAWIGILTGVQLSNVSIGGPADVNATFVVYGIGFAAMSAALALLNLHAWRAREALELDAVERLETRSTIGVWMILATTGLVAVVVGLAAPDVPGLPGWVFALLSIVMPLYGAAVKRRRRALLGAGVAPAGAAVG